MSKKRQLLVDTALTLFYQQGIHGVGINEVLSTSGVAKRTLYSHFPSKEALIMAALEQRHQVFMTWLEHTLNQAKSEKEVIEYLFEGLSQWLQSNAEPLGEFRGCFFINTAAEFHQMDGEIAQFCRAHKAAVTSLIQTKLSDAAPAKLNAIIVAMEGMITTSHIMGYDEQRLQDLKRLLCQFH